MLKFSLSPFACFRPRPAYSPPPPPPEIYLTTADDETATLRIESLEEPPRHPPFTTSTAQLVAR